MFNKYKESIRVGSKVVIPNPEDDDTWEFLFVTEVDDVNDDGMVIFSDDEWNEHEIEIDRVRLYLK